MSSRYLVAQDRSAGNWGGVHIRTFAPECRTHYGSSNQSLGGVFNSAGRRQSQEWMSRLREINMGRGMPRSQAVGSRAEPVATSTSAARVGPGIN